jgi:hypothetical protein
MFNLFSKEVKLSFGTLKIPTVMQFLEDGRTAGLIRLFTAGADEMISELWDLGIDSTEITDYELFLILKTITKTEDFKPLIDTDLQNLTAEQFGEVRPVLQKITFAEGAKPAKIFAGKKLLMKQLVKLDRKKKQKKATCGVSFESLILFLVCSEKTKYDYETIQKLTLHQFYSALKQVIKSESTGALIIGMYSGNIDSKNIPKEQFNKFISL